jgi:organic radical activating enzyme
MRKINYCEFYITNVCNLACPGCNRFNNYRFKGFERWEDHEAEYTQWAKELAFGSIGILGGEPLLNADFMSWLKGIRKLWPHTSTKVVTNGFYLNRVNGLYDYIQSDSKVQIWVGVHNKMHKEKIIDIVKEFLVSPLQYDFNIDNIYQQYMWVTDANGVKLKIEHNWWFHQGAIVQTETGKTLHNSDVKKAHDICHSKTCHHFMNGKLHKCGAVALFPEFDRQFDLELSLDDRQLMNSYQPLSVTDSEETKNMFIKNLNNSIPQCKFCPEAYRGDKIFAKEKKEL